MMEANKQVQGLFRDLSGILELSMVIDMNIADLREQFGDCEIIEELKEVNDLIMKRASYKMVL